MQIKQQSFVMAADQAGCDQYESPRGETNFLRPVIQSIVPSSALREVIRHWLSRACEGFLHVQGMHSLPDLQQERPTHGDLVHVSQVALIEDDAPSTKDFTNQSTRRGGIVGEVVQVKKAQQVAHPRAWGCSVRSSGCGVLAKWPGQGHARIPRLGTGRPMREAGRPKGPKNRPKRPQERSFADQCEAPLPVMSTSRHFGESYSA